MDNQICLEGPVEFIDGKMFLRIPLEYGGHKLAEVSKGISFIDEEFLNIEIQGWLADKLNISIGSLVIVDNIDGKLKITRSDKNDLVKSTTIDGNRINSLEDFYEEIERKLTLNQDWTIGHNFEALNDLLRGGFGLHEYEEKLKIVWINYDKCKVSLGWDETIKYLKGKLKTCHESNILAVQNDLNDALKRKGETLLELITKIIYKSKNIELVIE